MEEAKHYVAQADVRRSTGTAELHRRSRRVPPCRRRDRGAGPSSVDDMDVSPKQLVPVSRPRSFHSSRMTMPTARSWARNAQSGRAASSRRMRPSSARAWKGRWPAIPAPRSPRAAHGHRRSGGRLTYRGARHRGSRSDEARRRHLPLDEVPALQPVDLHQPAPAGQGGRRRRERGDHRHAPRPSRRAGAWPQCARRLHAVERV